MKQVYNVLNKDFYFPSNVFENRNIKVSDTCWDKYMSLYVKMTKKTP